MFRNVAVPRPGAAPSSGTAAGWLFFLLGLGIAAACAEVRSDGTAIDDWLSRQTNVVTWSADVIQTRTLKALVQPLVATGRVCFAAPNQFRWELGEPPQTIAVRQPDSMLVIYPLLKRVERYPLKGDEAGPWRDALALLEAGFPRSRGELESRFRLLSLSAADGLHTLSLQPRAPKVRRLMPLILVGIAPSTATLRFTEIRFADGSSLRNDFSNPRNNPTLPSDAFSPPIDPSWEVIQVRNP